MSDPIEPEERTSILVSLAEMRGQVTQALAFIATHAGRLDGHEQRLRTIETEQAAAKGAAANAGRWWGIGAGILGAVVTAYVVAQIGG